MKRRPIVTRSGGSEAGAWYVCLTADVVASRAQTDRSSLQLKLEACARALNESFSDHIAVPLAPTVGDEIQGLFTDLPSALDAEERLRATLQPARVKCGLGVGEVDTLFRVRTAEMDGPCFHRAREAVNISGERHGATVLRSGNRDWDDPVDAILLLLLVISEGWTAKQVEAVETYARLGTQMAAAQRLGISQPALRKRLEIARARPYFEARRLLGSFASRLWAKNGPPREVAG